MSRASAKSACVASRRGCDGLPAPIPYGRVGAPRGAAGAVTVAETARTRAGTLALRGPMMPQPFPPGAEAGGAPDGFLDTGYTCRLEGDGLTVTGPPGGILAVGGYRFGQQSLDAELASIDPAATLMAVPDGILGQRLAGAAPDPLAARAALHERGVNPLDRGCLSCARSSRCRLIAALVDRLLTAHPLRFLHVLMVACVPMSLQGPMIVVADHPATGLVEALGAAGAFPVVEAKWADAPTAFVAVKPAAVVIAEAGRRRDRNPRRACSACRSPPRPARSCRPSRWRRAS